MNRSKKIVSALAVALMAASPLAPTASFAATVQHNDHGKPPIVQHDARNGAGGKQVAMYGKHRDGKSGRHRFTDRAHRPAPRFEKIAFEKHPGFMFFAGHWAWQVNHWHWIAGSWQHR